MENDKLAELKTAVEDANHGIEISEGDLRKFEKQLQEGQKLNDEAVTLLIERNPTWTVPQVMDEVYRSRPQQLTHLEQSRTKALSALSFFRGKLKKATEGIKQIEAEKREEETRESAKNLFEKIEDFVAKYNAAQSSFAELKVLIVSHPVTDDLIKRAEMLNLHPCFAITAQTHLAPSTLNSLTMDAYASVLSELVRGGVGGYSNIPDTLKINFDGNIQTGFPINTPFIKRTNPTGMGETPKELLGRAEKRLNEVLNPKREPRRSRFVA